LPGHWLLAASDEHEIHDREKPNGQYPGNELFKVNEQQERGEKNQHNQRNRRYFFYERLGQNQE
jgi:hypothetical protein